MDHPEGAALSDVRNVRGINKLKQTPNRSLPGFPPLLGVETSSVSLAGIGQFSMSETACFRRRSSLRGC